MLGVLVIGQYLYGEGGEKLERRITKQYIHACAVKSIVGWWWVGFHF